MRLLVAVDGERAAQRVVAAWADEGWAADVVEPGVDLFEHICETEYDAVVVDASLPVMRGGGLVRQLRAARRWTPVLVLGRGAQVADRVAVLDAGADDYLVTPFHPAELVARSRALTRRTRPRPQPTLQVGDLRVDRNTWRAWRGEDEIALSPREFALLELFMQRPDQVITRTQILEQVWDVSLGRTSSNIVDQYVGYLRRKVDRPFGRQDLMTVRGAGYRLRADHSSGLTR